jgi:Tol biopolymer transport system component
MGSEGDAEDLDSYVYRGGISGSGKFVAFESNADNLMPNDDNVNWDIFVYNRKTRTVKHVSRRPNGTKGNDANEYPVISANGRYVAFESNSDNLVPNDDAGKQDVLVHDRRTKKIYRASVRSNGTEGNDDSRQAALSAKGEWVVFESTATNLVRNDDNGFVDIFAHNMNTGRTQRVSVRSNGNESNADSDEPTISDNGRFVVFDSEAHNLVANDDPGTEDVFVHDLQTRKTTRVSVRSNGNPGTGDSTNGIASRNGRFVIFDSTAPNLVPDDAGVTDIFIHDRETGKTRRLSSRPNGSEGNGNSSTPDVSASGRFVSFQSEASDLIPADDNERADIFVHDRKTGKTKLVSRKTNGDQLEESAYDSAISNDGTFVTFYSEAVFAGGPESGLPDGDVYLRGPLR